MSCPLCPVTVFLKMPLVSSVLSLPLSSRNQLVTQPRGSKMRDPGNEVAGH